MTEQETIACKICGARLPKNQMVELSLSFVDASDSKKTWLICRLCRARLLAALDTSLDWGDTDSGMV